MNVTVKLTGTPCKALLLLGFLVAALTASPKFNPNWSRLPAGTEITELRTATSHTFSNGDGTFTADIRPCKGSHLCATPTDTTLNAWPISTGSVARWVYGDSAYYYREVPLLHWRSQYEPYMRLCFAFAMFDLTAIPDSGEVTAGQLSFYHHSQHMSIDVRHAAVIPDTSRDEALWRLFYFGLVLGSATVDSIGWTDVNMNPDGISILNARLVPNWVTLGIWPTSLGDGTADEAILHVMYSLVGVSESQADPPAVRPELTVEPSPASGRFVLARYRIAGTQTHLILRDVLGRTVKSFTLEKSGSTHLDLRGFAPGIYMATLDASGQSVSHKLIIPAR